MKNICQLSLSKHPNLLWSEATKTIEDLIFVSFFISFLLYKAAGYFVWIWALGIKDVLISKIGVVEITTWRIVCSIWGYSVYNNLQDIVPVAFIKNKVIENKFGCTFHILF